MKYKKLGRSGLHISQFSFGSWVTFGSQVDQSLAQKMLARAYDCGVNFFDNAEVYADGMSETLMGKALADLGWSRDSYIVSSKVFWGGEKPTQIGLSRKHIFDACHAALKRLRVDYLDLYFCHRPDPYTPIEETVWAMNDLMRQGKILYWGTSEWSAKQIAEAHWIAKTNHLVGPTMEQPEYNMFNRTKIEKDYLSLFADFGLGTTIWSPLASGLLTGKYNNGIPKDSRVTIEGYEWLKKRFESPEGKAKIEKAKKLETLARSMDTSLTELSLAWCALNPNVSSVILGASSIDQLNHNLSLADSMDRFETLLSKNVLTEIDQILQNKPERDPDYR